MDRAVGLVLVGVLVLGGCGGGARQERRGPVVHDLEIEGTHQLSARKIKKKLLTSETGWWPLAAKKRYDPLVWETDVRRIEAYYRSRGYHSARVVNEQVRPRGKQEESVDLFVQVEEGPPSRVGPIRVAGLEALSARERLAITEDLPLEPGDVFTEERWQAFQARVNLRLRERGHARAEVHGVALVERSTSLVTLDLACRPGPRYRFGRIVVEDRDGAQVNPDHVVDQARVAVDPDELYADSTVDEVRRRVLNMGVFSSVRVELDELDDAQLRVPLRIAVQEAPFHTLRAGGGFGIDQVRNEARLLGQYTDRNFLGGLRRFSLTARVGWAFIPNLYAVLGKVTSSAPRDGPFFLTQVELEQPRLFDRAALAWRNSVQGERRLEQAYDSLGGRLSTGIVWMPHPDLTVWPAYNLEGERINGQGVTTDQTASLTLGCPTDPCFVVLSYLQQTVTWDRRNNPLEATDGYSLSLDLQEAGGLLRGDFTYLRVQPEVRHALPLGDELVLASRLRLGALLPSSGDPTDSPVTTRFYAGGGTSMRGFSGRRLSPLLLTRAPGSSPTNPTRLAVPVGGNGLLEASVELRWLLGENLVLATFVDAGTVTRDTLVPADLGRLLYAFGIGLRYRTPVGPVRLDLARRMQWGSPPPLIGSGGDLLPYAVNDSCFGFGGSGRATPVRDDLCVLHLSLGEAF